MRGAGRVLDLILEDTSVNGTKYAALDGLRGLAVLTVFFSHSSGFRQRPTPWTSFHGLGHIGVYLFFVLSGFLLAGSLLGERRADARDFFIRRFLRIAPLYYLILTTVFLLQLALRDVDLFNLHVNGGWVGFLRHLMFYQGDSVFWTIAAEFQFYLVLPLICALLRTGGNPAALFFAVMATLYFVWYAMIESGIGAALPPLKVARIVHHGQYLDVFLCGVLAAHAWSQPGFRDWWTRHQRELKAASFMIAGVGLAGGLLFTAENFFGFGRYWRNELSWWSRMDFPPRFGPSAMSLPYALIFGVLTLGAMHGSGLMQRFLEARWLRFVGVTGFSWYLIHFPVLRLSNWLTGLPAKAGADVSWTMAEPAGLVLSFVLTAVAASALYLAVERPFMLISRNMIQKRREAKT